MYADGRRADPMEAIVPVFRLDDRGRIHVLGTGFFISPIGLFVSAKHVLLDVIDEATHEPLAGLAVMHFTGNGTCHPRPVSGFVVHDEADVGVGVCHPMRHNVSGEPLRNKTVTLSRRRLQVGDEVWTYAYAGTRVEGDEPQHVSVDPRFYLGRVTEAFPSGRDRAMLPAPCFATSIVLHGGTSGGPVFSYGGNVVGVNSSGFEGDLDVSFVSRVREILDLGLPDVQLPGETVPRRVSIAELAAMRHVRLA